MYLVLYLDPIECCITYCIIASHDLSVIHDAMSQIFMDTLGCVKFTEYDPVADAGKDYVSIGPAIDG